MFNNWRLNPNLLIPYLLLSSLSLAMIFSVAPTRLLAQALSVLTGLTIFLYLGKQNSSTFTTLSASCYPLTILLLLATFALGEPVRGAVRWIDFGSLHLQTSELAKPLLVLSFAHLLTRLSPTTLPRLIAQLAFFALPFILIFIQPDFGTSLVIFFIFAFELTYSALPSQLWLGLGVVMIMTIALVPHFLEPYQLARLESFANPTSDPLGAGYNVIQSVIAVGSGGVLGKGLGHGTQSHLKFLPERHTDFMFASLAEELGLVGSLVVVSLEFYLVYYLLAVARHTPPYPRLVLSGVAGYLFFQIAINLGMNLGIAPVTGVTLPLISYGGSSHLAVSMALGLASSFAGSRPLPPTLEIV